MLTRSHRPFLAVAGLCIAVGIVAIFVWSDVGVGNAVIAFGIVVCVGAAAFVLEGVVRGPDTRVTDAAREGIPPVTEVGGGTAAETTSVMLQITPTDDGYDVSAGDAGSIHVLKDLKDLPFQRVDEGVLNVLRDYLTRAPKATSVDDRRNLATAVFGSLNKDQISQLAAVTDPIQEFACWHGGESHTCFNVRRMIATVQEMAQPASPGTLDLTSPDSDVIHTDTA